VFSNWVRRQAVDAQADADGDAGKLCQRARRGVAERSGSSQSKSNGKSGLRSIRTHQPLAADQPAHAAGKMRQATSAPTPSMTRRETWFVEFIQIPLRQ